MIAYCGLDCSGCPIYLATTEQDRFRKMELRESIAKLLKEKYGIDSKPEDINDCDGCRSESGRIYNGCLKCGIRECASGRHIENCAFCNDYYCELLKSHFTHDPQSKIRLDELYEKNRN